jgi:uncharacterized protein YlzI (FlbEa/FlbD family)
MAIQVSGTQVISDARALTNITGVTVVGTTSIEEVVENVSTSATTTGTINIQLDSTGVLRFTANQTANRTINLQNANTLLATNESVTIAILMPQGATAYYLNAYQIDTVAVTPKWQGGTAPTGGNASGIDSYSFTIIKTADATFTVLASQTQFA